MKILDSGQTPILSIEVFDILSKDPNNVLAFSEIDPLENPEISDPDELRKIVMAKRVCEYLKNSCHSLDSEQLPVVLAALKRQITLAEIAAVVDLAGLLGSVAEPEIAALYLPRDIEDLFVLQQLHLLTGNSHLNDTPRKRRVPTPRKETLDTQRTD